MAEAQADASEEKGRKKQFVLVVDGTPRDLLATSMLIQNFGYTVTSVRSAEEALEFISIAVPSLVVMEYILPGMNGRDLLDRIRTEPSLASIPVIVQTGFPNIDPNDKCEGPGCTLFLRKPVNPEHLYRAVQSTIEATPRQHIRISSYLRASIDGAGQGAELITMLSDEGMFIKTLNPRPTGTRHTVSFVLNHKIVRVEAQVLYTYEFGKGPNNDPGMGMKFTNLRPGDLELIHQFIQQQVKPRMDGHEPRS
jgi:CheY-like chemotaxis protein